MPYDNRHILYNYDFDDQRMTRLFLNSVRLVRDLGANLDEDAFPQEGGPDGDPVHLPEGQPPDAVSGAGKMDAVLTENCLPKAMLFCNNLRFITKVRKGNPK